MKKIVYIDMDGVLADFEKAFPDVAEKVWIKGQERKVPVGFFRGLEPIEGSIEAVQKLSRYYDIHILSTPQWSNPYCWSEKREWIGDKFGDLLFKKVTLTHHKRLLKGDYLIDDNVHEGFEGKHIHFGTKEFPNWDVVTTFLENAAIAAWEEEMWEGITKSVHDLVDKACEKFVG